MKIMTIRAPVGGVGRTTLLVHLADVLHARGHRVAVLDAHPQNAVGLHLGMDPRQSDGWFASRINGGDPLAAAMEAESGLPFLPFGRPDGGPFGGPDGRGHLETCLDALQQKHQGWLLVDAPSDAMEWAAVLQERSALQLHVLRADAQCLAASGDLPQGEAHAWVINMFEPMHPLQIDMQRIWRSLLGPRLLPEVVHRDRLVGEALAAAEPLTLRAQGSRVLHDFQGLAQRVEVLWQNA